MAEEQSCHQSEGGDKRIIAWHEAAHVVIGHLLKLRLARVEITENPQSKNWKGRAVFEPGDRVAHAVQLKAGAEAELLLGDPNPAERTLRAGGDGDVVETICKKLGLDPDSEARSFHLMAEARAFVLLQRKDVEQAIRALADALEKELKLTGDEAIAIIDPLLEEEAEAFDVGTLRGDESVQEYLRRLQTE
ncbi:MAG TPA: hypothetical protein VF669_05845 [Tepidisphaeraceae bacterium]